VAADGRTAFWHTEHRIEAGQLPSPAYSVQFTADGRDLVLCNESGLERWPLTTEEGPEMVLRFGPRKRSEVLRRAKRLCLIPGTRKVAVASADACHIVDLDRPTEITPLSGHPLAYFITASPDGHWLATGTAEGKGVTIWETASGRSVTRLPVQDPAEVCFSPDGRWLVTASQIEYRLWAVGSWEPHVQTTTEPSFGHGTVTFAPDGRVLACRKSSSAVQLLDPDQGRELAILPGDRSRPLCFAQTARCWSLPKTRTGCVFGICACSARSWPRCISIGINRPTRLCETPPCHRRCASK